MRKTKSIPFQVLRKEKKADFQTAKSDENAA